MKGTLGVVTVGQTPRNDLTPDLLRTTGVALIEFGALDGLGSPEIETLAPRPGEAALVTRLRDGSHVSVAADRMHALIQSAVREAESDPSSLGTLLMCTGPFEGLEHRGLLFQADDLLSGAVRALGRRARVGVICPLEGQRHESARKFEDGVLEVSTAAANPYGSADEVLPVARSLAAEGMEIVVLDCMGFDAGHRSAIETNLRIPTLLARTAVGRLVGSLLA
jgi:protein AroM